MGEEARPSVRAVFSQEKHKPVEQYIDRANYLPYREGRWRLEGKQQPELTDEIRKRFLTGDRMYVQVNGKIGDVVQTTAFIASIEQAKLKLRPDLPITLLVPSKSLLKLLEPLRKRYNLQLEYWTESATAVEDLCQSRGEKNDLVVDLTHYDGQPWVGQKDNNGTVIVRDLFEHFNAHFNNINAGKTRYARFTENLLGLKKGTLPANECLPFLPLPQDADTRYTLLTSKYKIDNRKKQIALCLEASVPGRMYDRWGELVSRIKAMYGNEVEINLIHNPKKDSDDPTLLKDTDLQKIVGRFSGVRLVTEPIDTLSVFLANQSLVIANDSGLSHIAAAVQEGPEVITLYLPPDVRPVVWETHPIRMMGVSASYSPNESDLLQTGTRCTDPKRKRINRITPQSIVERARFLIRSPEERPSNNTNLTLGLNHLYQTILGRNPDLSERLVALGEGGRMSKVAADLRFPLYERQRQSLEIHRLYQEIFGRDADPSGLTTYTRELRQGTSLGDIRRILVSSPEFDQKMQTLAQTNKKSAVELLFITLFGRMPDGGAITAYVDSAQAPSIVDLKQILLQSEEYRIKNLIN